MAHLKNTVRKTLPYDLIIVVYSFLAQIKDNEIFVADLLDILKILEMF